MSALIRKDFYVLWKQMRFFLLLVVVFSVIGSEFYTIFAVVWASMLPYTALAYDERSHWDQLAAMMPYSTRNMVLSKYVLGGLCMAGAMMLCLTVSAVRGMVLHTTPDFLALAMAAFIGIFSIDLTLPLVLRFGVERGRMGFLLVIICVAILGSMLISNLTILRSLMAVPMLSIALGAVFATAISIPLSIRMYQKHW
ncbi:MAG: ABC-2 transporter permease [Oscillibacter sp.]|jgi:ABC-2 type transport system permease protein|nr:ABC-2 transporter permease [Oscillibacter sp.]MCI9375503.1 ABC-2 transporter permease [Oscillibacter sp.]